MTWDAPVGPMQYSFEEVAGQTPLYEGMEGVYDETPWTASGEWVGAGQAPLDTGTAGLSSDLTGVSQSWWEKFTEKDQSTNILKAALGVGGMAQLVAGRQAAASQRQVGALNAAVLEGEAQFQLDKAAIEEKNLRKKYLVLQGKQKAGYGASGIKSTEGSPLMVLEDTYQAMQDDAALIRWGGDVAATKLRNQIPGATMEAELAAKKSLSMGTESLLTAGGRYWQLNS